MKERLLIICILLSVTFNSYTQVIDKIKDRSSQNKSNKQNQPSSSPSNSRPPTYNNQNYNNYPYNNYPNTYPYNNYPNNYPYNNYPNNYPYNNYPNNYPYNTYPDPYNYNTPNYNTPTYNNPPPPPMQNSHSGGYHAGSAVMDGQDRLLAMKDSIPEVSCIELYNDYSFSSSGKTHVFNPRLRFVRGMFATEFRYYGLFEKSVETSEWNKYENFDWQVLQLNLAASARTKLRIGAGLSHEFESSSTFFDWGISTDFYPVPQIKLKLDYRNSKDFVTRVSPRTMFSFGGEGRLGNPRHRMQVFAGFNANYTRFYDVVRLWTFGPTLYLRWQ